METAFQLTLLNLLSIATETPKVNKLEDELPTIYPPLTSQPLLVWVSTGGLNTLVHATYLAYEIAQSQISQKSSVRW